MLTPPAQTRVYYSLKATSTLLTHPGNQPLDLRGRDVLVPTPTDQLRALYVEVVLFTWVHGGLIPPRSALPLPAPHDARHGQLSQTLVGNRTQFLAQPLKNSGQLSHWSVQMTLPFHPEGTVN